METAPYKWTKKKEVTMTDYSDTNILFHVHDPEEDSMPSQKFTIFEFLAIFFSFFLFAAFMAGFVLYCSKAQEKQVATKKEGTA